MSIENQLNLLDDFKKAGFRAKKNKTEVEPHDPLDDINQEKEATKMADQIIKQREGETGEKQSTAEELAKQGETEYWNKVYNEDETRKAEYDRLAQENIPKILETINQTKKKSVSVKPISIYESVEPDRPYYEIYPYGRELRRKNRRK